MYKEFKVDFTRAQALKVLQGKPVRLSADQIGKGHSHNFHPENYKKLMKVRQAHKGLTLSMTHVGEPELAVPARAGLKALTGVGMEQDTEGGRLTLKDVRQGASRACTYAKKRRIVTDVVDAGEKYLLSKATKPEHEDMIRSVRRGIRGRYGVGLHPKGGSFRLG
ncbi:hypothetical protein L915_17653 [Phytophthora nicotianae]|uniref:Uncharacterized protein n=1 Tax=Phytophthora nicotianae TaxID=4792 RepID=W2G0Q2_PHYNI|nr:hypothetical protein L915_17653 [Phytophthora nicotianae]